MTKHGWLSNNSANIAWHFFSHHFCIVPNFVSAEMRNVMIRVSLCCVGGCSVPRGGTAWVGW